MGGTAVIRRFALEPRYRCWYVIVCDCV
eukprot:COSAG02_NODE_64120_length_261_cov_0.882716_1_plen_27_part_10